MSITEINSALPTNITPIQLLEKFKKGERPEFQNKDDVLKEELDTLAGQYKQSMSIDKKVGILNKERQLLYEELLKPELTLARNYEDISKIMPKELTPQEIDNTLRLFNITGIARIERLAGAYKHTTPKEHVEILKQAYNLFDETTTSGNRGRNLVISALSSIEERNSDLKPLIQDTYKELLNVTQGKELIESLTSKDANFDALSTIKELREKPDNDFRLRTLIAKSDYNNAETREFITEVLKDEKADLNIKRTAILGGGKFRSDENFEIIKNIAVDKTEKDIRKREFAIQSTALYIKDKPEEVKEVLQTVSREKSEFSPLGRVLLDKVTGNYHGQESRELKYAGYTKKHIQRFNSLFDRYFVRDVKLTPRFKNSCDLAVVPFRKQLGSFVSKGRHYFIQNDTYTKQAPDNVAKRYFYINAGIYNSGDYYDAFDGISAVKYNMMNLYRVQSSSHQNQMAHEIGHSIHKMFNKKDMQTLSRLYKKAKREDRVLDYYAAANQYEYFAQGCDAFASKYKPHKLLVSNDKNLLGLGHTIYELMDRDPDLFKFIKTVLKKYH